MLTTEAYLDNYPFGKHAAEARKRLVSLKAKQHDVAYAEAINSDIAFTLKQFLEDYPHDPMTATIKKKIIQAEVDEIMRGDHGDLPVFSPSYATADDGLSNVSITNETEYALTVRYSGPDVKKIEIPAGGTRAVSLSSGTYQIAASVDASSVRNYAGTQSVNGRYTEKFYISSSTFQF